MVQRGVLTTLLLHAGASQVEAGSLPWVSPFAPGSADFERAMGWSPPGWTKNDLESLEKKTQIQKGLTQKDQTQQGQSQQGLIHNAQTEKAAPAVSAPAVSAPVMSAMQARIEKLASKEDEERIAKLPPVHPREDEVMKQLRHNRLREPLAHHHAAAKPKPNKGDSLKAQAANLQSQINKLVGAQNKDPLKDVPAMFNMESPHQVVTEFNHRPVLPHDKPKPRHVVHSDHIVPHHPHPAAHAAKRGQMTEADFFRAQAAEHPRVPIGDLIALAPRNHRLAEALEKKEMQVDSIKRRVVEEMHHAGKNAEHALHQQHHQPMHAAFLEESEQVEELRIKSKHHKHHKAKETAKAKTEAKTETKKTETKKTEAKTEAKVIAKSAAPAANAASAVNAAVAKSVAAKTKPESKPAAQPKSTSLQSGGSKKHTSAAAPTTHTSGGAPTTPVVHATARSAPQSASASHSSAPQSASASHSAERLAPSQRGTVGLRVHPSEGEQDDEDLERGHPSSAQISSLLTNIQTPVEELQHKGEEAASGGLTSLDQQGATLPEWNLEASGGDAPEGNEVDGGEEDEQEQQEEVPSTVDMSRTVEAGVDNAAVQTKQQKASMLKAKAHAIYSDLKRSASHAADQKEDAMLHHLREDYEAVLLDAEKKKMEAQAAAVAAQAASVHTQQLERLLEATKQAQKPLNLIELSNPKGDAATVTTLSETEDSQQSHHSHHHHHHHHHHHTGNATAQHVNL